MSISNENQLGFEEEQLVKLGLIVLDIVTKLLVS